MPDYESYNPDIDESVSANDSLTYVDEEQPRPKVRPSNRPASKDRRRHVRPSVKGRKKNNPVRPEISLTERLKDFFQDSRFRIGIGIAFLLIAGYILMALLAYIKVGSLDQSEIQNTATGAASNLHNPTGEGGARLSEILVNDTFGVASAIIVFWLSMLGLRLLHLVRFKVVNFTIKCLVTLITASLIVGLLTIGLNADFMWGGAHGFAVNQTIIHFVGWPGAALLCILLLVLFFMICLYDVYKYFRGKAKKRNAEREVRRLEDEKREELERKIAALQILEEEELQKQSSPDPGASSPLDMQFSDEHLTDDSSHASDQVHTPSNVDNQSDPDPLGEDGYDEQSCEICVRPSKEDQDKVEIETESGVMTVTANEIGQAVDDDAVPDVFDPTAELSHYQFPSYNLLNEAVSRISIDQDEQLENQEQIRSTLADFGIGITEIKATVGPTVTLYEIRPDKGVKISRIRSLGDDIALSLAATGVRIIAPIPGKGTVGIEVANKDPQTVAMRTIITSRAFQQTRYDLPIAIGSTIDNRVYIADLAKMPHLLVAGATGQGKSVGLNAIITSLLYSKHPAQLKFVLVDPKMVEFSLYQALERHYLARIPDAEESVITHTDKVVPTLSSLCVEMDARYELLKAASVRNVKEYNEKFVGKRLNPNKGHRYMPYIVVIVDEFADLIMTSGKEVETPIARLAQKARAVGIHVILATQRPSANVITGVIKANFPARIAFKVASGIDSRTVLDATGAEHLIGRGDMLVSNNSEMERVQCAFIDTPEVTAICNHINSQVGYPQAYILPEPLATGDSDGYSGHESFGDKDPLFDEIARLIVTSNTASTSSLQRRYSIGYNRAGKIMDQMEAAGIVGPSTGGKPRQVLIDSITLESILSQSNGI